MKTTVVDLQINASAPGLRFHRIEKSKDPNFWSVRVSGDLRLIIHKTANSLLVAYVDHHDKAYAWAERRRIETHPRTGAVQIVELHARIEQTGPLLVQPRADEPASPVQQVATAPAIFAGLTEDALLNVGTPADWIADIRTWSEDRFFHMSEHLPAEVAEALLEYAATGRLPTPDPATADPFEHPDTRRRVQTITNEEELRLALEFPWDRWSVFLHPSQRDVVERDFAGPARVTGTAGTGKTIVALHRAARAVKEDPKARVLLSSFSRPLANALRPKLHILLADQPVLMDRISVASFEDVASELYQLVTGRRAALASPEVQQAALERAVQSVGYAGLSARFILSEWRQIVDAWNLPDLASYATVPRLGRRNRLGTKQREALWPVFETARQTLSAMGLLTSSQLFAAVEGAYRSKVAPPYTHVIVDEAQDLGMAELRMMGALAVGPNALFFAGDLGQRIFQLPFSWLALGVDVRGRSSSLRINYRTSRQIREAADHLLPPTIRDVDGMEDDRTGAQSVFDGPAPTVHEFDSQEAEATAVAAFLQTAIAKGVGASEIGVFVRSQELISRARSAVAGAGLEVKQLSESVDASCEAVSIGTMHLAKGLEFKLVIVMACDDEALPLQSRVDDATDEDELQDVFETERHLLYVACTRARDRLYITAVRPGSDFLSDLAIQKEGMSSISA